VVPKPLPNSARYQNASLTSSLVAPFTEMPFDCHAQKITPTLKLADVQDYMFMAQFGRPL